MAPSETMLVVRCYNILCDKTSAKKDGEVAKKGYKQIKNWITLLLTCKWIRTMKSSSLAIGKFGALRCFYH
ncbi:MAG: hypothetical protein MHPSP_004517, partial [Paramarteilia canceri]